MLVAEKIFPNEREKLYKKLEDKLETTYKLNRKTVSFQANKEEPVYRWFKYKEGFSSKLVKYFLTTYSQKPGKVFDPFAGAGTTLFAGQELGWEATGIELLPVGEFVMQARQAANTIEPKQLSKVAQDPAVRDMPNCASRAGYVFAVLDLQSQTQPCGI